MHDLPLLSNNMNNGPPYASGYKDQWANSFEPQYFANSPAIASSKRNLALTVTRDYLSIAITITHNTNGFIRPIIIAHD
jgi:hypothetical protein